MALSTRLFLDTRHQKKDGNYRIKVRITINRKSIEIATPHAVEEKYWDEAQQKIRSNCPSIQNTTRFNRLLHQFEGDLMDKLLALESNGDLKRLSLKDIKARLNNSEVETLFFTFGNEIIAELEQSGKVGNARVYKMTLGSIKKFQGEKDFPLRHITYAWLKHYEAWYLARTNQNGKPNTANGLNVNMRTLRALYNSAIKRDLVPQETYPFKKYTLKREATRKRAISPQDIAKLKATEPQTTMQHRAKDYFLISFYLMGASFIDLAFLKMSDVRADRIEYKRKKTGRLHSIKITPALQEILEPYLQDKTSDDFLLNIIHREATLKRQYAAARNAMKDYNRALKELAALAGISESITSYTARHTFATIAKYKGVPVAAISDALGHADVKTTQIYLDQFDNDAMDAYNEFIIGED